MLTAKADLNWRHLRCPIFGHGPGARALRTETIRHSGFHGSGGHTSRENSRSIPCRGDRPVARRARLILRKPSRISEKIPLPADAFCAQRFCARAKP